ncbi:RNA-binding protein 6 isoform X2 [Xiphophorus hellerii]|uniref:RNA-binding protein 6 isoform X2 n=1 Tax=Xiphophorus hellerii TaxID=8084 RepID=UPI0013B3922C|nr:RNA-binding protein 6-like isoform X2 [Xiphophorus hellerii]
MWDGPGPRGRPPFRGDHRGEMFWGRDRPMPDYRDGMNMGHRGPRPLDFPPMDQRRMDGFPMRGHDMAPGDMRGRGPNRDFFMPRNDQDFHPRRHVEISIRDQIVDNPGFRGPGRDLGGRGMPPWEPHNRFSNMRDREIFHNDMNRFDRPDIDGRRGFPMDRMERDDGFRDMPDRHPGGIGDADRYEMDLPPHERRLMDNDGREGPPFNPRGKFESDMDFRNRPGPAVDFRDRDRSPLRFGPGEFPPAERERLDMAPDVLGRRPEFKGPGDTVGCRDYPDASGSPLMDYRSGEEMTLAEEWKSRQKDKNPFLGKDLKGGPDTSFPVGLGSNVNVRDPPPFQKRDHFPSIDPPIPGKKGPQDHLMPETNPLTGRCSRNDKEWSRERDPKYIQNKMSHDERVPYLEEQNKPSREIKEPSDSFRKIKDGPPEQIPFREKLGEEEDYQSNSTIQAKDQDYRDIDYRTASRRVFDYKHEELPPTEKFVKDPNPITPSKFTDSGSQDRDYRNASVKDKVSNIISISGIPKTDSVDQILGAFAVRDGVPMQGIKIQNVVPGYSYDMAYVEFLNLEDAVHFMESNKGSIKVGTRTSAMEYVQPNECERVLLEPDHRGPPTLDSHLPPSDKPLDNLRTNQNTKGPVEELTQFQRNTDLTPEAWQQQVDQQHQQEQPELPGESSHNRNPLHMSDHLKSVFKDSKTMIIKNVKPTTTVETILKALDPFAYLDERNVRLVKGKPPGTKCFCFVDMDSHEQVRRLVELITKPRPLCIDGVRVHAEIARPLKNQNLKRDYDAPNLSMAGHPSEDTMTGTGVLLQQPFPPPPQYLHPLLLPMVGVPATDVAMQGDLMNISMNPATSSDPSLSLGMDYNKTATAAPALQTGGLHVPTDSAEMQPPPEGSQTYIYGSETPDTSSYLYDSTSGFYYDPETTLYYDPNSRYFYNAQTQEYLYWDGTSKTYIPVPGGNSAGSHPAPTMTAEDQAILSNPAADAPLEMKKPSAPPQASAAPDAGSADGSDGSVQSLSVIPERKEDEDSPKKDKDGKDEKPRSLAAVKIMKDMERWAKIQNRQKETVRSPSPVLKSGVDDEKRQSKSADAAFAIFERKITGADDLFKKPLAPVKKDEKSKRPMGSLGLLASDYGAGSDEEVEEDKEEAIKSTPKSQPEEKDRLTDWKKMACLLCRRQFPNKDALIRHQQLSDLHKQNMEIHLKIKRSKKELEALENQEKQVGICQLSTRESSRSPEQKRRKQHHQQQQQHGNWAGSSRDTNKASERPGLGAEPVQKRKTQSPSWDHNTYKQAVRKAMFARFKELE